MAEDTVVKENIINVPVESFTVKEKAFEGETSYILEGLALPYNQFSRNGVLYRQESIEKKYETLKGRPLLFNHKMEDLPIGRVEDVYLKEDGMYYKAELDAEEARIANKMKRDYLNKVSIQCTYENPVYKEDGTVELDVGEFLELSVVTVPGFADTTAVMVEKLKSQKMAKEEKQKKEQEQAQAEEEHKKEDVPTSTEQEDDEDSNKDDNSELVEELANRVSILESRLDALEESSDDEDEDSEEESRNSGDNEDEDEEEEKKESKQEKAKRKAVPTNTEQKEVEVNPREFRRFKY